MPAKDLAPQTGLTMTIRPRFNDVEHILKTDGAVVYNGTIATTVNSN